MKEMTIEEIRKCSVGVLDYIDQICKENNLQYYLCGGTLLGAARHQGFIPWDDDIDIMMPRSDYEKLLKVWSKDSFYSILNFKSSCNFPHAYTKIYDKRTVKYEKSRNLCPPGGIDVDVFPIDSLPDDNGETVVFYKEIEKLDLKLHYQSLPFSIKNTLERTLKDNLRTLSIRVCEILGLKSIFKYVKQYDALAQKFNTSSTNSCGITCIHHYGIKEKNPKHNYCSVVDVMFEGKFYPAPVGYKDYLQRLYGKDYMELPPVESRISPHGYKAYWIH